MPLNLKIARNDGKNRKIYLILTRSVQAFLISIIIAVIFIKVSNNSDLENKIIFGKPLIQVLLIAGIISIGLLVLFAILKKLGYWDSSVEKFKTTKVYRTLKKGDLKQTKFELFKFKENIKNKLKNFINRIPLTQIKNLYRGEKGKKVTIPGKELAKKLKMDKLITNAGQIIEGTKKVANGVFVTESKEIISKSKFYEFPEPTQLLNQKISEYEKKIKQLINPTNRNKKVSEDYDRIDNLVLVDQIIDKNKKITPQLPHSRRVSDDIGGIKVTESHNKNELRVIDQEIIPIPEPEQAPIDYVPQVDFLNFKQNKKMLKKISFIILAGLTLFLLYLIYFII